MQRTLKLSAPASSLQGDINITPLVDVVLVLLIIFMVVTPLNERNIGVRLPETNDGAPSPAAIPQVVVALAANGEIRIDERVVVEALYSETLSRILATRVPTDRVVLVAPEGGVSYGRLVGTLDAARLAGAQTLGLINGSSPVSPSSN